MHGPTPKPQNATDRLVREDGSFDLAEVMRFAWAKLATNARLFAARRTGYRITFREALREAWTMAKHMRGRRADLAEIAAWDPGKATAAETFARRRAFAECCDDDARRRAELAQIDREERATAA